MFIDNIYIIFNIIFNIIYNFYCYNILKINLFINYVLVVTYDITYITFRILCSKFLLLYYVFIIYKIYIVITKQMCIF